MLRNSLALCALVILTLPGAYAQAPSLINFQGQVDSAGVPFTGTRAMVFRIYDAETGGSVLFTENQSVTVVNGQFTALVGSVTAIPASVFQSAGPRFLGVTIGGSELTPRYRFGSTGYSLRAATADAVAVGGVTSQMIADQTISTIDIQNDAITSAKIFDGEVGTADIDDNAVTSAKIADLNITAVDMADNAVTAGKLANNAVTSAKIADGNVSTADLADNAVVASKVADEPGVAQKEGLPPNTFRPLPSGGATGTLDSIGILAPAAGVIVVTANFSVLASHTTGTADEFYFQVMAGPAEINFNQPGFVFNRIPAALPTATGSFACYVFPVSVTRAFAVTSGIRTFYVNSRVLIGSDAGDQFYNMTLNAHFVPTAYGPIDAAAPAAQVSRSVRAGE